MLILISTLVTIASRLTGYAEEDIKGPSRKKHLVAIRAGIVKVARDSDPNRHSYPSIGRRLGGRDHSSIINLWQLQDYYAELWPGYRDYVATLKAAASQPDADRWMPAEEIPVRFVNSPMRANNARAEQKRKREAANREENARKQREHRAKLKLEIAKTSEAVEAFHRHGMVLTDDEVINAIIASGDRTYRNQMARSSQRFRDALLAA